MILIGECIEGIPIWFDEERGNLHYKYSKISLELVQRLIQSNLDRTQVTESLTYEYSDGLITLGCLTITKENANNLINLSWKLSKKFNKVGN